MAHYAKDASQSGDALSLIYENVVGDYRKGARVMIWTIVIGGELFGLPKNSAIICVVEKGIRTVMTRPALGVRTGLYVARWVQKLHSNCKLWVVHSMKKVRTL